MIDANRRTAGPVRTETQAKQGTGPRIMVWVLLFSILLAIIIGGVLLSNTKEIAPGTAQTPAATQPESPPATTPQQ